MDNTICTDAERIASERAAWNAFIAELKQCAAGRRGWVQLGKARADRLMIAHSNLTIAAESLGLTVERHGKYGWTARRGDS